MKIVISFLLVVLSTNIIAAMPIKWQFHVQGAVDSAPAVAKDGTVYVGSESNHLWAINPDGTKKWAYSLLTPIVASPAISPDESIIYVTNNYNGNATLYAFTTNEQVDWKFDFNSIYPSAILTAGTPKVDQDGSVFVDLFVQMLPVRPDNLSQFNVVFRNKTPRGFFLIGTTLCNTPPLDKAGALWESALDGQGGVVSIPFRVNVNACDVFQTRVMNYRNDRFNWSSALLVNREPFVASFPAIDKTRGMVYVGGQDGRLYAYRANSQGHNILPAFNHNVGTNISKGAPVVANDGTIYVGGDNGNLFAVNPDGTRHWTKHIALSFGKSPAVDNQTGNIYITDQAGNLYALDKNGDELWMTDIGMLVSTSPTVGADGTVYVGTQDGYIIAFNGRN